MPSPRNDAESVSLGLFAVSFVVLSYEVTQLRVFAYALHPVLAYSVIAITMLGFGAASTVLSLSARLRERPLRPLLAASAVLLSVTGLIANLVFARMSAGIQVHAELTRTFTVATLSVILLCMLPYACGGLCVALVLSRLTSSSGRLYSINLLGSGLGCLAINFVICPLGAERLTLVLLALAALAGVVFAGREAPRLRLAAVVVTGVLLCALPIAPRLLPFRPDPSDQHETMEAAYRARGGPASVREFAAWDPVAKVEIHSWPGQVIRLPHPVPFKMLTQDAGAGSILAQVGEDPARGGQVFEHTCTGLALALRPGADALIIGLGGASDVQAALYHKARHITGVEINGSTIRAVREDFADFLGWPYAQPGVEIVHGDGRSFVHRTTRRFDVIALAGTDTVTPQSAGGFVFAEEYLYTTEAFRDYLGALGEDGVLSVVRFWLEPVRLSLMAAAGLRHLGVARPEQNIVVISQGFEKLLLVKRTPWRAEELAQLDRRIDESQVTNREIRMPASHEDLVAPLAYLYAPHRPRTDPAYARLFEAIGAGQSVGVTVPTDDRPYYFNAEWADYFKGRSLTGPVGSVLAMYGRFSFILLAVALLAILLPLALTRARGLGLRGALPTLGYFFALGFCFMLLEIGLIQKAILVVEHPSYSIAVVLASLFVATSVGSRLSQRLLWAPGRIVALAAVALALVGGAYVLALNAVLQALMPLPFPLRMILLALVIALLGIPLGMLFPTGLRRLGSGSGARLVPWAIAVNGFASVIGSVLSLPCAVLFGFSTLFACGVALYLVGCLAFRWLPGGVNPAISSTEPRP